MRAQYAATQIRRIRDVPKFYPFMHMSICNSNRKSWVVQLHYLAEHTNESQFSLLKKKKRKAFISEKPFSCEISECTRKCIIICKVCTMLIWMPVFVSSRITKTARKSHHPKPTRNPLVSTEEEPSEAHEIYAIFSATHQQLHIFVVFHQ